MGKDDTFKGYINCVLESIPMVPARYLQKLSAPGNRLLSTCQNGRAALLFFQVYALDIILKKNRANCSQFVSPRVVRVSVNGVVLTFT